MQPNRRCWIAAATGLLLVLSSALLWQFRFVNDGPALPLRIDRVASGWLLRAPERFQIGPEAWTLGPPDGKAAASAEGLLPGMESRRFLHVVVDAKWDDVTRRDDRSWWSARISLGGKRPDGSYSWPQDGDLINASGSRGWHRVECVFELSPGMGEPRLFINHLAATGTLEVRRLTVTPVRQRPWIPGATAVVVLGWLAWVATTLGGEPGRPRRIAASVVLVAAGWFLVFPQPHYHARPFPGGFVLGRGTPAPPDSANPAPAGSSTTAETHPSSAIPAPEARGDHRLVRQVRRIDRDWRFAHVAAFGAFGFALFLLAGVRHGWPAATGVALLSEVVPNLLLREFQASDAVDLIANFAGIGLAALSVMATIRIRHRLRHRES